MTNNTAARSNRRATSIDDDDVKDFSSRRTLRFRVDDDVFEAAPDIAAELALKYAQQAEAIAREGASIDDQIEVMHSMFRMLLLPESADRFIARLGDAENPIGHAKITDITKWLFEEYGMRPMMPDSVS